jgi:hypothetical protein
MRLFSKLYIIVRNKLSAAKEELEAKNRELEEKTSQLKEAADEILSLRYDKYRVKVPAHAVGYICRLALLCRTGFSYRKALNSRASV